MSSAFANCHNCKTCFYQNLHTHALFLKFKLYPFGLFLLVTHCLHRLHGRVVKGAGDLCHDEAMEAGGREFDPRPGHCSMMSF